MALNLFGVTVTTLGDDCFPKYTFDATSAPTSTRVTEIINRAAALVCGPIQARGLDPASIDATGEPLSYYACQRLVTVGAAVDVSSAITGYRLADGLVDTWRREWTEGRERLENDEKIRLLLPDALTGAHAGAVYTHVQASSDTKRDASDIELPAPVFTSDMDL